MKKRFIAFFLCVVLCVTMLPTATFAAKRDTSFEKTLAQDLKALGLFQGVSDTEFDLDRAPTRVEALIMLIRLLGKDSEATGGNWRHPFTDVPAWADNYVGYAYQNKLTNGTSATTFGTGTANAQMYLTFVLRALGYSDTNGADFVWNNPYSLAEGVGILPNRVDRTAFWRADVVLVSYAALSVRMKNSTQTLAQKLIAEGAFTYNQYANYYDPDAIKNSPTGPVELSAEQVYEKYSPAVFYVEVYDQNENVMASGSGFFLDSKGTAVTNYHVIEGAYSARILTADTGKVYSVAGVYDYDKEQDWAVIQVDGTGFSHVNIGKAETIIGGATVYAIGSPLGLENTISQGLISNTNRVLDGVNYIQTSAAISHGSSGGALFNKYGEVIGITSGGFTDGENLGLALPISVIDGYSRGSVTTLASLAASQAPALPPTGSAKENASNLLRAFIHANANEDIDGDIAYTEYMETENGYIEYSVVDGADGDLYVLVWENFLGKFYYNSITLDMDGDSQFLYYSYNLGESYYYEGYGMIYAPTFNENSAFSFPVGEGTADRATNERICHASLVDGLDYVNYIFDTYLSEYGNYSVQDFGYTSFY